MKIILCTSINVISNRFLKTFKVLRLPRLGAFLFFLNRSILTINTFHFYDFFIHSTLIRLKHQYRQNRCNTTQSNRLIK